MSHSATFDAVTRAVFAPIVARALAEDLGRGDATTLAVVPQGTPGRGVILAKQPLTVAGLPLVHEVFAQLDPAVELKPLVEEGTALPGTRNPVMELVGPARSLLIGERLALNFLQHCSGIATQVQTMRALLPPDSTVRLADTRKTRPGLRLVEKYAVRIGGGANHRLGLDDGVMIKDNHIRAAGGIGPAVAAARRSLHHLLRILVEVTSEAEALEAIAAGAEVLLLDNFTPEQLTVLVPRLRAVDPRVVLEASGGIDRDTVARVAAAGVDVISSGALIHQARWVDLSLELD